MPPKRQVYAGPEKSAGYRGPYHQAHPVGQQVRDDSAATSITQVGEPTRSQGTTIAGRPASNLAIAIRQVTAATAGPRRI